MKAAGAVAGAAVMSVNSLATQPAFVVLAMLAWTGGLITAVQITMYALAAHVSDDCCPGGHPRCYANCWSSADGP